MKFSEQWLREWVDPSLSSAELVEQITMAGLEVDAVENVAGDFSGVVVAEVVAAEQHPNADKLSVCKVNNGAEELQIVCGAPNVRVGLKVALAQVGALLKDDFKIKAAKLRDVESQGMLCSEAELEISEAHDGIMELADDAPVGQDLREYLQLNDAIIDVDLTPNRGDCLGLLGLAREVGALNGLPYSAPSIESIPATHDDTLVVKLTAPADCPRYVGRLIKQVNVNAATPLWLKERLRRSGIRSIDPVVDVTNYVMLELGQPMHAFDSDRLQGGIEVRRANPQEKITLLDGKQIELEPDVLVICDDSGPLAMAGVMGGEGSGVSDSTQAIFLESAFFNPISIAGRGRRFGLHTDSSHRFERGVDYALQTKAIERATALLLEIVGGEPGPIVEAVVESELPSTQPVLLRRQRIKQMLKLELDDQQVENILSGLELPVVERSDEGWRVGVPSWRFDISLEADLLEELARVYGYNRLPLSLPQASLEPQVQREATKPLARFRNLLLARGYNEAITYSFVDPELQSLFADSGTIDLANPISSDMSQMRTSLWPGLIQALQYNLNRQQESVRLFETGLVFLRDAGEIRQLRRIGGVIAGNRHPEGWTQKPQKLDFYDVKAHVEGLLQVAGCRQDYQFAAGQHQALHPGQASVIYRVAHMADHAQDAAPSSDDSVAADGDIVGYMGALHPAVEKALGLAGPVFLFELDLSVIESGRVVNAVGLSKFPEVRRDLAVILDQSVPLRDVIEVARAKAGEALTDIRLFDLYAGEGISPGRKSLALGLTWQHRSRTLTDEEISQWVDSIINDLEKEFNAVLRR